MDKKIIAFFDYNGTNFVISLIKETDVLFLKKNKKTGEYEDCLSSEELEVTNKIFNSLKVDKINAIFVKNINLNDNKYNLFFDKKTKNYFWESITENYEETDNTYLNFKYNHQPEIVYSAKEFSNDSGTKRFYNKFIKIGKKLVMVTVAATLVLSSLSGCSVRNQNPEVNETTTIAMETTTEKEDVPWYWHEEVVYNWDDLKQIISDNNNLSQEDKELIYKMKFIFDENHQYMNLQMVYHNLSELSINHNAVGTGEAFGVGGCYERTTNTISVYYERLDVIVHEILHALQIPSSGGLVKEISNEFFTREVLMRLHKENLLDKEKFLNREDIEFLEKMLEKEINVETEEEFLNYGDFGRGYDKYIDIYYILANMLPTDVIRKYQFSPTDDVLADALDNATNIGKGYELLDLIKSLSEESYRAYSETHDKCYEYLDAYHKAIKGYSIENDFTLSSIMSDSTNATYLDSYGATFNNYLKKYNLEMGSIITEVFPKTFLSNAQNQTILIYKKDDKYKKFIVTDDIINDYYNYSLNHGAVLK